MAQIVELVTLAFVCYKFTKRT